MCIRDRYKADRLLSGGTGKVKGVTIHNTNDLKNVEEDAEQYLSLIHISTLGFAAALLLMRCPVPAVSVTAFIGVAVSLGWACLLYTSSLAFAGDGSISSK